MTRILLLLVVLVPTCAAESFVGLYAQADSTQRIELGFQTPYLLVSVHSWYRVVDEPSSSYDVAIIGTMYEFHNASVSLDIRPSQDAWVSLFATGNATIHDPGPGQPHNLTTFADAAPGQPEPRVHDIQGTCKAPAPWQGQWTGNITSLIWGYTLVIDHDAGTDRFNAGFSGAPWALGAPMAYEASTIELWANATGSFHALTERGAVYYGQCPHEPAQAAAPALALPMIIEPREGLPTPAAVPVPPAAVQSTHWPSGLLAAVGLALLIAPRRRMATAAFRRGHYKAALVLIAFSFGRQAALLRARSLDGCRLHYLAARAFARLHAKTGLPDHADRAAIAYALAGQGPEAARWLLLADAQNCGILRRMRESHFERVAHDAVFTAAVRRIAGLADPSA